MSSNSLWLLPDETSLVGAWVVSGDGMSGDAVCDRIESLVESELKQVASDESGWYVLYRDPRDGRLWELNYPQGEMHGGGPPALTVVSIENARRKYGASVDI
jgi:hypothetical protein